MSTSNQNSFHHRLHRPHRRRSIRLSGYDYAQPGDYFITICTYGHKCTLGEVVGDQLVLSEYGRIVQKYWMEIPYHFNGIELGVSMVMPNHIHGIVTITGEGCVSAVPVGARHCRAPTLDVPLVENFGKPVSGSIPTIIRSFKSSVTYAIHGNNHSSGLPIWQRNYYEHIIETEKEYLQVEAYIENNPANWAGDEEFS